MKKLILSILLLVSVGFGITPTKHPFDIKNLHYNKLDDFLPFNDEDSQIRLERMSIVAVFGKFERFERIARLYEVRNACVV